MSKGLFIVFEGIDGSGTTTQRDILTERLSVDYVLPTEEPWKSDEIRRMLQEDRDSYSSGERMAELFVNDRKKHQEQLIIPALEKGAVVLCDRHALSTYAYQGTQEVQFNVLKAMHDEAGIIMPDLTLYLDVDYETARARIQKREGSMEKFEKDAEFVKALIGTYREITGMAQRDSGFIGRTEVINGNPDKKEVAESVFEQFALEYNSWVANNH